LGLAKLAQEPRATRELAGYPVDEQFVQLIRSSLCAGWRIGHRQERKLGEDAQRLGQHVNVSPQVTRGVRERLQPPQDKGLLGGVPLEVVDQRGLDDGALRQVPGGGVGLKPSTLGTRDVGLNADTVSHGDLLMDLIALSAPTGKWRTCDRDLTLVSRDKKAQRCQGRSTRPRKTRPNGISVDESLKKSDLESTKPRSVQALAP
jgi:hypothetical protein